MMKQLRGTELKRFTRDWRRAHRAIPGMVLVLQSVTYPVNVGSLFRVADAVGVREIVLTSATPTPPQTTIAKVGRDKHRVVPWRYVENTEVAVQELRQAGYHITALEIADAARPYYEFAFPDRTCLVLGNEDHGVSRAVLDLCDSAVFVPMMGKGLSMNVHVSAAVVLYHILAGALSRS